MRRLLPLLCLATGCKLFVDPTIAETCEDLDACDGGGGDTDADTDGVTGDADGDGYTVDEGDCNDGDAAIHPGAAEVCDEGGVDENCDGLVNDDDPAVTGTTTVYVDLDGDGWGDAEDGAACRPGDGQAAMAGDCDDDDGGVNPDAEEVCGNGKDDDCDGTPGTCVPYEGAMGRAFAEPGVIRDAPDEYFGLWSAGGDLTGDGVDDLVTSAPTGAGDRGLVLVYTDLGPATDVSATETAAEITGADATYLGVGMVVADVDGDGGGDLLARDTNGVAFVFPGPLDGALDSDDAWLRIEDIGQGSYGTNGMAVAPDSGALFVGDPYAGATPDLGAVYGFDAPHGGGRVDGPGAADRRLLGTNGDQPGHVMTTGDFDGDGVTDLVTADPFSDTSATSGGLVWVVRDGLAPGDTLVDDVGDGLAGTRDQGQAGTALAAADLDGDGTDDLVIGAPGSSAVSGGQVLVISGAPVGIRTPTAARTTIAQPEIDTLFGYGLSVGDLSGDGQADLVIAEPDVDDSRGAVHIMYGPIASGRLEVSAVDATIRGSTAGALYGSGLNAFGDVDGDGSTDVLVTGDINALDVLFGGGW